MNKKVITIMCTIGIILAVICAGYILVNSSKKEEKKDEEILPPIENVQEEREERSQNIVLNSRAGEQITDLIKYSNLYSEKLIDELDNKGISNKFKILTAFDKIITKEEYQSLIGYSQTYSNTYVLASNMQIAISDLFVDDSYTNENVESILYYDAATVSYAMITTGVQGIVKEFVVEVPFRIDEYSDRIELKAYRVYVNQSFNNIDGVDTIVTDIYYDKARTQHILKFTGLSEFYDSDQIEYLRGKIADNTITQSKLEQVKYTIVQDEDKYKFKSFEKIKE